MLLLTTRGRHTGELRTVPLLYLSDADQRLYVIASWGGRPYHPDWYFNLLDDNRVEVQLRAERLTALAQPLVEPGRSDWWSRAVDTYEGYREYQARTDRVIPIVRLTPDRGPD